MQSLVVSAILTRGACDSASFAFDDAAESVGGVAGREVFGLPQMAHFDLAVSVAERLWEAAAAGDAPAVAAGAQAGAVKQHAGFGQLLVAGDHLVRQFGSATGALSASLSALARTMIMTRIWWLQVPQRPATGPLNCTTSRRHPHFDDRP